MLARRDYLASDLSRAERHCVAAGPFPYGERNAIVVPSMLIDRDKALKDKIEYLSDVEA